MGRGLPLQGRQNRPRRNAGLFCSQSPRRHEGSGDVPAGGASPAMLGAVRGVTWADRNDRRQSEMRSGAGRGAVCLRPLHVPELLWRLRRRSPLPPRMILDSS